MKRLLISLVVLGAAGCSTFFTPSDAPATINRGHWRGREVMFTFDARESDYGVAELLDKLRLYRVPAAFFVTGLFVEQHPDLTRRMAAEGHEVYNHSYSNPLLRHAPEARIVEQLRRADAAIVRATGRTSKPFFRPAFGEVDENLRRVAFREGYRVVRWTLNTDDWRNEIVAPAPMAAVPMTSSSQRDNNQNFDWTEKQKLNKLPAKEEKPPDPVQVYATNVVAQFQSGTIVLFHVGYTNTLQIIEPLIKVTRGSDYTIVPLRDGVK
ncbi:MAG: polysaccharide deacetylase family protein [Kiritimatiellaeota bacterium]|nr:polysaccharide deacetylase family protein [Kiritimatiellota bacterium]